MKKHFISVLGTGNYSSCRYGLCGKEEETKFVQEAVLKTAVGAMGENDKITVFLTKKAEAENWEDRAYNQFELNRDKELKPGDIRGGLKNTLFQIYGENIVKAVRIPEGKTEEELDQIFEIIYEEIQEEEEVHFDITHGLRNIPMQALTILNYARVLKKITIAGIYYGAFEVRNEEGVAPIFNLSRYNEILEWTSAADAFVNAGDSRQIKMLYKRLYDEKKKNFNKLENKQEVNEEKNESVEEDKVSSSKKKKKVQPTQEQMDFKRLGKVIDGIVDLTSCLETGRGKNVTGQKNKNKKSIYQAYVELKKALEDINETQKGMIKPLKPLFEKIEESIEIFNVGEKNGKIGMAAVEWAIRNHLLQQGYTALEETMKTVVCELYGLSGEEGERDAVVGSAIKMFSRKLREFKKVQKRTQKEGEKLSDIFDREKVVVEFWEEDQWNKKNKGKEQNEEQNKRRKKIGESIIREVPEAYANLMNKVTNSRNSINHFGFQHSPEEYTKLEENLKGYYKEFKQCYENYKEQKMNG